MRTSSAVALFAVLGFAGSAMGQAKSDRCANLKSDGEVQECRAREQQGTDPKTDALAAQMATKLRRAIENGKTGAAANDPMGKAAGLRYDVHMSDCEDRWVALYHNREDRDYSYGFVYIDPQAGFTLEYAGRFTVDGDGGYHEAPNPIPANKMSLKIRLDEGNGVAALLPPRALAQLKLPEKPDWLKYYNDDADAVTHKVKWGFFYNAIGDSRRAIDYLQPAYSEKPDAPRVVFELAYAYNAVGRPADAIRVSKSEFARNPKDELLCREMAFAYLRLKSYKEATEQYQACIALCDDSTAGMAEKSEFAMNLAVAYQALSDMGNRDAWLKKAREWAPKGSAVYKHFHPDEQ